MIDGLRLQQVDDGEPPPECVWRNAETRTCRSRIIFTPSGGRISFSFGSIATMIMFRALVLAALLAGASGCRPADPAAAFGQSVWGGLEDAKSWLRDYKHVVMVCVYEDRWEDRGPNDYSLHHFKATVVKTYKGSWRPSQRLAFVHGVDDRGKAEVNRHAGELMFVFTNEHKDAEIGVDTGDFLGYEPELDRQLRLLFPALDQL